MDEETAFETDLVGRSCRVERREHDWVFDFGDGRNVVTTCPWRLVDDAGIGVTNEDHDQWFGMAAPVNAGERANAFLENAQVILVRLDRVTSDLCLNFTNGWRLDVFNNSSGYEGWSGSYRFKDERARSIFALGGGGIAAI